MSILATAFIPTHRPRTPGNPTVNIRTFAPSMEYIAYDDLWSATVEMPRGKWQSAWARTPGEAVNKLWARLDGFYRE
jgi:hypothetical protein